MKKYNAILFIIASIITGGVFYTFFLKNFAIKLYCQRQIDFRLYNFTQAVRKNSSHSNIEENADIKKYLHTIYQSCLENN